MRQRHGIRLGSLVRGGVETAAGHFGETVIGCWELDETKRQVDQQGQNLPRERVHIPTHRKANRRGKAWEAEEKVEGRS